MSDILPDSENSPQFHQRMRQAMAMSFHKYGAVNRAFPHKVSAISSLRDRLRKYDETGNADYLVDVANFAMIEFMLPAHELAHDKPTDGGEGRVWFAGGRPTEKGNEGEKIA